jgi:hypothetical protein
MSGGADPLTGSGRYVPDQTTSQHNTSNGTDPFTGINNNVTIDRIFL